MYVCMCICMYVHNVCMYVRTYVVCWKSELQMELSHHLCRSLATMVIQHGTLCVGDVLVAGEAWCRVRTMLDDRGGKVTQAPPSTPILTTGWRNMPLAGEICLQVRMGECGHACIGHAVVPLVFKARLHTR